MSRTMVFDGKRYTFYNYWERKRDAQADADARRRTGKWRARVIKSPYGGYDVYVRPVSG